MNKIKLSLVERYNIIKYAYQLPCSTALRLSFDDFIAALEMDEQEQKQYTIDTSNGEITSSDNSYVKEFDLSSFPEVVINSIKNYVEDITEASSGDKPVMDKKYVESVSKWLKLLLV